MGVSQITRTADGYSKHSKLIPSAPELIASKVFSLSDKYWDKFSSSLEELYKNPMVKPLLDVIAVQIAKNDDIAIIYGATLPITANGCYTSSKNIAIDKLANLPPQDQDLVIKTLDVLGHVCDRDPLDGIKKIEFQAHLPYDKLLGTISHEFGHAVADIIFDNSRLGFKALAHKAIYEQCRNAFALKLSQLLDPKLDPGIYPGVAGSHLLSYQFNRVVYINKGEVCDENKLLDLCNILLPSTDAYRDTHSKDCEIFARTFEAFASIKDFPIAFKLLSEFAPYFEQVLNPSIDAFMRQNLEIVNDLGIRPNGLGSYGFPKMSDSFDPNEELYFAVVSDNMPEAKKLILEGADPSHVVADFLKPISIALFRGNHDLFKFMLENSKDLKLDTVDATGRTTTELAEELGSDAFGLTYSIGDQQIYEVLHEGAPPLCEPMGVAP